jgi:hypothetical protein
MPVCRWNWLKALRATLKKERTNSSEQGRKKSFCNRFCFIEDEPQKFAGIDLAGFER